MDDMVQLLEGIGGVVNIIDSYWFNGLSNFPLHNYSTNFEYENWLLTINYEFRESEFSKTGIMNTSSIFQDRHLVEIKAVSNDPIKTPDLSISFRGGLANLFKIGSKIKVKCADEKIKEIILMSSEANNVYKLVYDSSEFSPIVNGMNKEDGYKLGVNFNTGKKPLAELEKINLLFRKLITTLNCMK